MTNLEIIQAHYAASAQGDIKEAMRYMSSDMAWTEMAGFPYGGTYRGVDEILAGVFERINNDWENFTVIPNAYHDAGESILVAGHYSGTYKKTGKSFKARFMHVWKLKDEQIIAMEQFVDTLLVDEAMHPRD